ncbi:LytR/AlgR family response regulator transcription factor [Sediminibacterium soli]|uniref:LytR/AlgR family response regulator transcription factor n=1 Tax=Sediminibacterium soli TaxID=2698829 RepID=UPI00137A6DC0|nr:LytTR family DNA-binding domain-containing protein [Sediminibacterium soli]NCI46523.1 response regulator transcription factor [Sediminibacterium soli]
MTYSCIAVEDNIIELHSLVSKIKKITKLSLAASFEDPVQAVHYLKENEVDIVFSDIDMPDLSGISLLRSLKKPPVFVFISAHSEHAAESFELDVIDFIVKPVQLDRLIRATDKAVEYILAKKKLGAEKSLPAAQVMQDMIRTIDAQDYFFVKEKNNYIRVNMGDVLYIESMGDFSKIITVGGKSHFILVSLKNLEKQLPDRLFARIHKQYIINLLHIIHIGAADIKLTGNAVVPLSGAYRQLLLDNIVAKKTLTRFGE